MASAVDMWVILDHPPAWPHLYVAHCLRRDAAGRRRRRMVNTLTCDRLAPLQRALLARGLTRNMDHEEHPMILELWQ